MIWTGLWTGCAVEWMACCVDGQQCGWLLEWITRGVDRPTTHYLGFRSVHVGAGRLPETFGPCAVLLWSPSPGCHDMRGWSSGFWSSPS